jgi:hypothetical protein
VRPEGLGKLKKLIHLTGFRTRDLNRTVCLHATVVAVANKYMGEFIFLSHSMRLKELR